MLFAGIALLVILVDQVTKYLIVSNFSLYETWEILPGFFNLTSITNNGAAFSMLAGQPALWRQVFFITATVIALVVIFIAHKSYRHESRWYSISLALIAGGAIGNLIDRVRLTHVIDFLDVYVGSYHWPTFNVADSGITVGVTIFLLVSFVMDYRKKKNEKKISEK